MIANNSIAQTKAGEIMVSATDRGTTLQAFNHERNQYVSIGTVSGLCYEKGNAAILHLPEPSFTLSQSEFSAALELGAQFLRLVTREKVTYSIELSRFDQFKEPYYNGWYGPQWRVPLSKFDSVGRAKKRNAIVDNPRTGSGTEYQRPQAEQLPMFRPAVRFNEFGEVTR